MKVECNETTESVEVVVEERGIVYMFVKYVSDMLELDEALELAHEAYNTLEELRSSLEDWGFVECV